MELKFRISSCFETCFGQQATCILEASRTAMAAATAATALAQAHAWVAAIQSPIPPGAQSDGVVAAVTAPPRSGVFVL
ncbi:MAG: hypothetical protein ACKPKO_48005, partial [Candidatus Fonsibacter sp.]